MNENKTPEETQKKEGKKDPSEKPENSDDQSVSENITGTSPRAILNELDKEHQAQFDDKQAVKNPVPDAQAAEASQANENAESSETVLLQSAEEISAGLEKYEQTGSSENQNESTPASFVSPGINSDELITDAMKQLDEILAKLKTRS